MNDVTGRTITRQQVRNIGITNRYAIERFMGELKALGVPTEDDEQPAPAAQQDLHCDTCGTDMSSRAFLEAGGNCPACGNGTVREQAAQQGEAPAPVTPQRIRDIAGVVDECDAGDLHKLADWLEGREHA